MARTTRLESYMISLINAERAEAGLRPLRFDRDLNQSADAHSTWMLARDIFSHAGRGGSDLRDRVEDAGYQLTGSWSLGENLGLRSKDGDASLRDEVRAIHNDLMDSPGHRANILGRGYDEAGIGIKVGEYQGMAVVMVTQNFGRTRADDRPAQGKRTESTDDFVFATRKDGQAMQHGFAGDDRSATITAQAMSLAKDPSGQDGGMAPPWHDASWMDLL